MSVSNPSKIVTPGCIRSGGTATVTLGFCVEPALLQDPAEIVLLLDCSSSMTGERMAAMKAGARLLVERVSRASGGLGFAFRNGTRMGLVSYAGEAVVDAPLTDSAAALLGRIDGYVGRGATAHGVALRTAMGLFTPGTPGRKIIVLFTDGETNAGGPPAPVAAAARAAGIELYCLGLEVDRAMLEVWASAPTEQHVLWTGEPARLPELFSAAAARLGCAGAADAVIDEQVAPEFEIVQIGQPSTGTARQLDSRTLRWEVGTAGTEGDCGVEYVSLAFTVRHLGQVCGELPVNSAIRYQDCSGATLEFPQPTLVVEGCPGGEVVPEPCPVPLAFTMDGCQDSVIVDLKETALASLGRIIQLNTTLKAVCPRKRVALAVLLTELGPEGQEYSRGMKTLTVPAHTGDGCRDVEVRCIRFIVPEQVEGEDGRQENLCGSRSFRVRAMANYLDTDFVCCDGSTTLH